MLQLSPRLCNPFSLSPLGRVKLLGWIMPPVLLIGLLALSELVVRSEFQSDRQARQLEVNKDLASLAGLLTYELHAAQYFTLGLKAYLETNDGHVDEKALAPWLTELQKRGAHIRNIGLAPGNRISYIYPLAGNEGAVGLYYPDAPTQWPEVKAVIETRKPKLIGPFDLRQGGRGLVYREAIYLHEDHYWGLVSTVISADSLFASLLERARSNAMSINIFDREEGRWLLANDGVSGALQEVVAIPVVGRQWDLVAGADMMQMPLRLNIVRWGGWVVALFSAYLLFQFFRSLSARMQANRALENSQKLFQRVFSASPQAMALIENDELWLEVNPSFYGLLGLQPEELQDKKIIDLFMPEERERVLAAMQEIDSNFALNGVHFKQFEARLASPVTDKLMGLVSLGICYRTAKKNHWTLQIIDISERTRLDNLKRDFVSMVSHELRTPLTSILGGLKLLAGGSFSGFDENATKIINIALHNGERLSLLINDLLDMEKLVAGKMQFQLQEHDLISLIKQSLESIEPYAAQYQVRLVFTKPDNGLWVKVDDSRLLQVMANLLSNAVKFSPPDGEVSLSVEVDDTQVRVIICDQGEGVALADQGKLFKRFSQVDSSSTRKKGGTGLGLAISKELIEMMEGTIGYQPALDGGSCFYFELARADGSGKNSSGGEAGSVQRE
jgi:two-component system, OmpR family, sensor histidine kinase VicK